MVIWKTSDPLKRQVQATPWLSSVNPHPRGAHWDKRNVVTQTSQSREQMMNLHEGLGINHRMIDHSKCCPKDFNEVAAG